MKNSSSASLFAVALAALVSPAAASFHLVDRYLRNFSLAGWVMLAFAGAISGFVSRQLRKPSAVLSMLTSASTTLSTIFGRNPWSEKVLLTMLLPLKLSSYVIKGYSASASSVRVFAFNKGCRGGIMTLRYRR